MLALLYTFAAIVRSVRKCDDAVLSMLAIDIKFQNWRFYVNLTGNDYIADACYTC